MKLNLFFLLIGMIGLLWVEAAKVGEAESLFQTNDEIKRLGSLYSDAESNGRLEEAQKLKNLLNAKVAQYERARLSGSDKLSSSSASRPRSVHENAVNAFQMDISRISQDIDKEIAAGHADAAQHLNQLLAEKITALETMQAQAAPVGSAARSRGVRKDSDLAFGSPSSAALRQSGFNAQDMAATTTTTTSAGPRKKKEVYAKTAEQKREEVTTAILQVRVAIKTLQEEYYASTSPDKAARLIELRELLDAKAKEHSALVRANPKIAYELDHKLNRDVHNAPQPLRRVRDIVASQEVPDEDGEESMLMLQQQADSERSRQAMKTMQSNNVILDQGREITPFELHIRNLEMQAIAFTRQVENGPLSENEKNELYASIAAWKTLETDLITAQEQLEADRLALASSGRDFSDREDEVLALQESIGSQRHAIDVLQDKSNKARIEISNRIRKSEAEALAQGLAPSAVSPAGPNTRM